MHEILVNELRDEHRDREWVDTYGFHWISCDGDWLWWHQPTAYANYTQPGEWVGPVDPNKRRPSYERDGMPYGPGPFMEAMHYTLLWKK